LLKFISFSKTNKLFCLIIELLKTKLKLLYPSNGFFWGRKTKPKNPSLCFLNAGPIENFRLD
jgi:hypothetical protein